MIKKFGYPIVLLNRQFSKSRKFKSQTNDTKIADTKNSTKKESEQIIYSDSIFVIDMR